MTLEKFFADLRADKSVYAEEKPRDVLPANTAPDVRPDARGRSPGASRPPGVREVATKPDAQPSDAEPVAPSSLCVEILFGGHRFTTVSVDSVLGKGHFSSVHDDVKFLSDRQFRVFRNAAAWMIEHVSGATNETIVDGHKLDRAEPIRDRMRVSVGNTAKGTEKFPLEFRLVRGR